MQGKVKERWMELCEQAANEQDSEKLHALVTEINNLLEAKERRVQRQAKEDFSQAAARIVREATEDK